MTHNPQPSRSKRQAEDLASRIQSSFWLLAGLLGFCWALMETYAAAYSAQASIGLAAPLLQLSAPIQTLMVVAFIGFFGLACLRLVRSTGTLPLSFHVSLLAIGLLGATQAVNIPSIGATLESLKRFSGELAKADVPAELKAEVGKFLDTVDARKDCEGLRPVVMADFARTGGESDGHLKFLALSQSTCGRLLDAKDYLRKHNLTPTKPLYPRGNPA